MIDTEFINEPSHIIYMIIDGLIVKWDMSIDDSMFPKSKNVIMSSVHVHMSDNLEFTTRVRLQAPASGYAFSNWTEAVNALRLKHPEFVDRFIRQVQSQLEHEQQEQFS